MCESTRVFYFFFNDTATTEIYTLSLHDALPISDGQEGVYIPGSEDINALKEVGANIGGSMRSEEHTSELQSRQYLVCRLLLEKKKTHLNSSHANITYAEFCLKT